MKAGLLEIGDVFVVNKSDCPGADEMVLLIESAIHLRNSAAGEWRPPVVKTVAVQNQGVDRLIELLCQHRRHSESTGRLAERRASNEFHFFRELVLDMATTWLLRDSPELAALRQDLSRRTVDPYSAAEKFLERRFLRP